MTSSKKPSSDNDTLKLMGYSQELSRTMSGFSNFAISLSIICILAGGITSFHLGFSSVGGAAIGLGWPLGCLFSLLVGATMGQLASSFPTAGGLYHWAAILGGRAWGWMTAWLNLAGLITVLAAINVGTFIFAIDALGELFGLNWQELSSSQQLLGQTLGIGLMSISQGIINHRGIRLTTRLTNFSGYLILLVAMLLTVSLLVWAPSFDLGRLIRFANYSGAEGGDVWPAQSNLFVLFALGLLLPAYTVTGFDASAHAAEETIAAASNVPRGIVRSIIVSGVAGWIMLIAIVLAMPSLDEAARQGPKVFFWLVESVLPTWLAYSLYTGIIMAQYLCGLATVTSASRMMFAFARDGGLPFSTKIKQVSPHFLTPAYAIWAVVALVILFTIYTPVYSTITVVCVIFLYLSYIIPVTLGVFAHGRSWQTFGPWTLGVWFKPAAIIAAFGCLALIWIGVQPPNDKAIEVLAISAVIMSLIWFGFERRRFVGPKVSALFSAQTSDSKTS